MPKIVLLTPTDKKKSDQGRLLDTVSTIKKIVGRYIEVLSNRNQIGPNREHARLCKNMQEHAGIVKCTLESTIDQIVKCILVSTIKKIVKCKLVGTNAHL